MLFFLRIDMKMTNFEAFCRGFWSVWDFTRPFSEKPEFRTCYTDVEKLREQVSLNEGIWDTVGGYFGTVGGYLNNAMQQIDKEIENNDRNTHTKQNS